MVIAIVLSVITNAPQVVGICRDLPRPATAGRLAVVLACRRSPGCSWLAGDFNGDGKTDLAVVWNDGGLASVDVHLSTGSGFGIQRWQNKAGSYDATQSWLAGDFNHDGKTDLAVVWNDGGLASIDVHLSSGIGFDVARWQDKAGSYDPTHTTQRWFAGDFNSDGYADVAVVWNDGDLASVDVHLERGGSFGIQRWENKAGSFDPTQKWSVGNFTGSNIGTASLANAWNDGGLASVDVHHK